MYVMNGRHVTQSNKEVCMMDKFRVKTERGYYGSVGTKYRRYGRIEQSKIEAEILCDEHAREIEHFLAETMSLSPEIEPFPGHAACAICKRKTI
jgi:hypothetical protein